MKRNLVRLSSCALLALAMGALLGACEQIVYRDRPLFQEPATAAAGFVGYSDAQQKLTVCGQCHTSVQRQWRETAHANAWERLLGLGGDAQANFGQFHSTNEIGNLFAGPGGWTAVGGVRYQDVQCESCHGPSLDHVRAPTRANWPLAPIAVGTTQPQGCGQCHSTAIDPYHQEWARSAHGRIPNAGTTATSPAGRDACWGCHTGEDALVLWGVRAEFIEKQTHVRNPAQNVGISCAVCHDPHRLDIPGQLRHPINVPSEEENLCMKCHHKRGNPDPTTFRGPHSPEGPTLLGYAGAWVGNLNFSDPNNEFTDTVNATHGSERNPRLCAGCHVVPFESGNPLTGEGGRYTGHTFEATPCVDAAGLPVPGPCPEAQRTYRSCTGAGCHGTQAVARTLEQRAELRITRLTDELDPLIQAAHTRGGLTTNWRACRGTGNCPGSPLHWGAGQATWTVALAAAWNYELARFSTGARAGQLRPGQAVHNPILLEVLLISTIREMRREYNLPAQTNVSLERTFGVN